MNFINIRIHNFHDFYDFEYENISNLSFGEIKMNKKLKKYEAIK